MQTDRTLSQYRFEEGCSTTYMHERTTFCNLLFISEGVKPKMKRTSKECHHSSSPKPKKFWTQPSAGKIMLSSGRKKAYSWSTTCLRRTLSEVPYIQIS
jgi:hypothetical protein